jgi:hypothetical protein
MEFPLPHDPVFQAAQRNKKAIEGIIHDIAERAGTANPQGLAQELCLIMEGAYITRMVTANPQTIDIARRLGYSAIDAALPGRKRAPAGRKKR